MSMKCVKVSMSALYRSKNLIDDGLDCESDAADIFILAKLQQLLFA